MGIGGEGDYTLETVEKAERGAEMMLHLREGEDELLSRLATEDMIRKYSDHIALPIVMKKEEWMKRRRRPSQGRGGSRQPGFRPVGAPKNEISRSSTRRSTSTSAHDFETPLA